jgi:peptide/nickel transport system permease protein
VLQGLLTLLLTLFGLLLVTFALSAFSPVDRVLQIVGDHASQSTYDQVRHQLGLDQPLPVQFWHYLQNLAHGDLGTASATGQPVLQDLLHAFPATLELATLALIIGALLGVIAGVLCARYAGSRSIYDQHAHPARQLGADFLARPADAGAVLREAAVERRPRQAG